MKTGSINNRNIDKDFHAIIEVSQSASEIFLCLTEQVPKWWGGRDFMGHSTKLNDQFVIHHPGAHYSKQKLIELIPDRKVVWAVEESNLFWLKKQDEWTDTKMIFQITVTGYSSVLHFTHHGLTPDKESYERCSEGWNLVIKHWLKEFITEGKPHFIV